jgi:hypothetical protein
MQSFLEFRAQKTVDRTVASDSALAPKGLRNYPDSIVGSARGGGGAGPLDGMSMACMQMRFVYYFEDNRGQGCL